MSRPTPEQIRSAGEKAMKHMREKFSPRRAIRLEDIPLDTPLDVLRVLILAYVPQGTSDAAEGEKALNALAHGLPATDGDEPL